ncbi:oxygen-regulated protein 1 [Alosa alosa]|uniref:oxygen-regulated protein 1 n=1 Tax=Alosa alosa TaxID=278164 RepID=UPI00201508E8|nr:oxygen-regulated protein 1 [Alosa alosa]
MSVTPHPDLLHAGLSPGSVQTLASRARPPPTSNPITSKRVCFYKSGDPQFGGLRMVINGRTFKTYDALLDALSKKVPLPFGVRTITTPRGTNSIRALEEFQDGGSYVCSDQKRIKPLNLEQANRRQVPWNTTRPISAKRRGNLRQIPRRADFGSRAERMIDRNVTVRTPKRLVVYKNRDPTVKRIVVLQRKTAPTFDALLDYLCQVMQFPVVKLFTPDGRRVEGLAGLILCSGVVVAAGNEPFRLLNFNFQGGPPPPTTQSGFLMDQIRAPPQIYKKKSPTSSTRSRKFSLSSERYFVNQIKKSLSESLSEHESHHSGSLETELNQPSESVDMEPCVGKAGVTGKDCPIMPTEDDIEKSFRVNQDGSMTVEMKVRLTIKQEEMIHWTTTLSRTSVSCQQTKMHATQPVSGPNSPDVNNDSSRNGGHSAQHTSSGRTVAFKEQEGGHCNSALAETSRNLKHSKRTPTPGPRRVKSNNASVENITTVTETEVQESTVGTYSYMERTSEGEVTEGYCVVRSSSTSNIRPVPKPRKTGSAEAKQSTLHSSLRASGVSEVLQIQKSGLDVTETFMHIYEPQPPGSYDNYLANPQHVAQKRPSHSAPVAHSKPGSTDSGPCSSNNDCDVDLTRLSSTSDSNNGKKDEMFSLSSESMAPQQTTRTKLATGRSTGQKSSSANEDATHISPGSKKKRTLTSRTHKNASPLSSGSDKKQRTTQTESSKTVKRTNSSDNIGKTGSSPESAQSKKTGRVKKREKDNNGGKVSASKSSMSALSAEQGLILDESAVRDLAHNLNSSESEKPKKPKRKNVQDILVSHQGHTKMSTLKQKSMSDDRVKSPKQNREINESISLPRLCSPPSVQQYVETWLQQMQPDSVPYLEELNLTEAEAGKAASKGSWENSASEIISEEEENLSAEDKSEEGQEQQQPTQSQLCVDEPYGMRGLCRSMPSVRVHPAEQDCRNKLHQSAEVLFPLDTQPSEDVEANLKGGMKPVLQQLCSSLQSIRRVVIPNQADSLAKAQSLPDFSVQVASVFGASSAKLLSFLSVMALKDRSQSQESLALTSRKGSYPEALKVIQSLEKLASTEDEEELRASLSDLRKSTSPTLQESWKDFREKYDIDDNPLLSPKNSEQEFILEVHSLASDQNKDQAFDIEQLMEELSMSEELRQEISSLAEGEITYHDATEVQTGTTDKTSYPETTYTSTIIRANDIEDSEVVEVMSIAQMKEGDRVDLQCKDHTSQEESGGSPLEEECSIARDYDTTKSPASSRKGTSHVDSSESANKEEMSYSEAIELPSEYCEEYVHSPRESPLEEGAELKEEDMCSPNKASDEEAKRPESVNTQASSPPANSPEHEASDMAKDYSVHSVYYSEQEGVASTHGEGSPTNNNPHSLSADDEECISEGVLSSHNAERKARVRSADEEDRNSPEVLPSQSEEGDEEVIPHEIDSSCHHSQVSESKLKEFVQEESEHCNSQDLDMESVAQIEEAATSGSDNYTSIQKDNSMDNLQVLENTNSAESLSVSGSERKYLSSAESAKSQKTNKSKRERKGNRSEMSSVRSTTSTNTGTKRVLSSTEALHLGVATSRGSTPRGHIADSQGPLPNVRKSMTPTNPGRIKKVATKPKSLHEDNLNTPKENLSGSISMPFLSAPPSDVHQYVDSWLEKMQPDTDIEGTTYLESERKAEFRIGTSSSERSEGIMSASAHFSPEEEGLSADENADDRPQELSGPVIQIRCDGELVDDSPLRMRSFCRSMPSVRIHPADQERQMRAHKSTEALFPLESESPQDTGSSFKGGMKPMLQQLCASMQSIRLAVSPTRHLSLEKARSLPDFSVQVASVFGASSTKLLSFLSVMTLKDGSSGRGSQPSLHSGQSSNSSEGLNSGKNSCPEALKVMQSLEKLANTEDEEELRNHQKNVEREFALDVQSEASDQNEDQAFGIEQLMEELSMSEELRQEMSSLVEGEMTYHDAEEPPTGTPEEGSQPETANTVIKADDVEEREQVEVMPVAYTDNVEKADSMDEDNVEEPSNIQTKTVKAFNSIEEGRSLSNEEESIKCEETGSRTGESEDIDNERFLTPLTESEPKDMDRDSESWKGHDTDHQSEEARYESGQEESVLKDIDRESASWKGHDTDHQSDEAKYESDQESVPKDMGRDSESWKGHDTDHQSEEARYESGQEESVPKDMDRDSESWKGHDTDHQLEEARYESGQEESVPKDMDRDSKSWKGHDTDHQSEEARYESGQEESVPKDMDRDSESWKGHDTDHQSDEAKSESDHVDLAAEKEGRCGDKHDEEEEGHVQQSDDLGEEEEGHVQQSDDLGEEEEGHVQQSDDLGEEEEGHVQQSDDLGEDEDGTGLAKDKCSKKQADDLAQADALVEGQKDSLEGVDSCESHNDTHSENGLYPDEKEEENDQQGYPGVLLPGELSQELLAFVNKALLSSSLTFTYDSNGNLRIQPEVGEAKSITEMLDGKMNIDSQYGLKRLPSPNTSDLSDYRSDTADSGEKSQLSLDISTDVGDEEPERVSTSHDQIDQNSEESDGKLSAITENGSATSPLGQKSNVTPKSDLKSVFSFNSNQDTASMVSHQDNTYLSSSLNGDSESVQCLSFYSQTDLREGVLIDKGRWLLKENHLIRTSPPLTMGMYDQVDSSSVDSGQDEDVPSSQYLNHQSPLAVISSSELEEMAKPSTPKCTYFTIPHSSDSDPFLNYKSSSNGSGRHGEVTRGNRVSPQEQPAKTWAKKNSSFSSFASVEFKLPDGKIHPQGGAAVERPARSQTIGGRTLQEEDSTESLQLRCGQNCPIL